MKLFRERLFNYFSSRDRGWILTLILTTCLLYLPFIGNPFFFDDLSFFMGGIPARYAHSWFHFDLRWFSYATLGWTEQLFSSVVTHFFHLGNLLLHICNVVLLFYLMRHLISAVIPNSNQRETAWGAWFGALIFALHPVAVYAVGYVVERSILMATMFSLIMLQMYLRGLVTGRAIWFLIAIASYFLAVFSKEHSVLMPVVAVGMGILLRGKIVASRKILTVTWGAFAAIAITIALIAKGVFGIPYEPMAASLFEQHNTAEVLHSSPVLHLLSVLTQAGLFFKYLLLWIVPNPAWMSIDMREPFIFSLDDWIGWTGAFGFIAFGAFSIWLMTRRCWLGLAGFAMLYPWLQFLLEFSTIRIQEPFVLYRSYLWMPGFMLFVPILLARWPTWRMKLTFGLVVFALIPIAANRLWTFADGYRLWNDAAMLLHDKSVAGADRIYFNRGQAEEVRGQIDAAIADFERSIALSPQYAPVHFELGWLYARKGQSDDAMRQFDAAIADDPSYASAYYGKAMLFKLHHQDQQAAIYMAKSCELKQPIACLIVKGHIENRNAD